MDGWIFPTNRAIVKGHILQNSTQHDFIIGSTVFAKTFLYHPTLPDFTFKYFKVVNGRGLEE